MRPRHVRYACMNRKSEPETIQTTILNVRGMSCGACVRHVTRALEGMRGVSHVEVSLPRKQAIVEYDPSKVDLHALRAAVRDAGYDAFAIDELHCRGQ
jgi:copper chaperone